MAAPSYQLVMRSGPMPGKAFDLEAPQLTIGRDVTNDIAISDAEVSRKHARLIAQSGSYVIEDMGSTNGTFVNGQRLMGPHLLRPGELILLGENVSLSFEPVNYDPDATRAAAYNQPAAPAMPPAAPAPAQPEYYQPPSLPPAQYPQAAPQYPPQQPPAYAGQVPPGPVEAYAAPEEPRSSSRIWILAGCLVLVLICLCLVAALFYIDAGGRDRWCQYLGFLFAACR